MSSLRRILFLLLTGLLVVILAYGAARLARPDPDTMPRTSLSVAQVMGQEASPSGFARAREPRPFVFPRDHGPHPDFRTEWWYITGNLESPGGAPFGFQITFFRNALKPEEPMGSSPWRTRQVYMGHFAVTDSAGEGFHAFERFSRGAVGLAGARSRPFRVWIEDWELRGGGPEGTDFPWTLGIREEDVALRLRLSPAKPLVLQGDEGLSQKGPEEGNASYYYSYTRLEAQGEMELPRGTLPVRGRAWMDREWSTSALSPGQVGWDWFALQLDDGHDLMYYQLRREDGSADPLSKGRWVRPNGTSRLVENGEVGLRVTERWQSPLDGAEYPGGWRLELPREELSLRITPLLPDQELRLTFRYWEGAVRVEGTRRGERVTGRGYVELTGYAEVPATESPERRIGRTGRDGWPES
jgi:predicted secreted hydrolase